MGITPAGAAMGTPWQRSPDRSFRAYVRATVGARGASFRLVSAALFSAALIFGQGVLGVEIVLATLVGGVLFAYPLWRKWGRRPEF
jgi:hypothetical protein